jgi:hypothetical protein
METFYQATWSTAARWFLVRLIFDPDNGGDMLLRNIGSHTGYTAIYHMNATFITTAVTTSNPTTITTVGGTRPTGTNTMIQHKWIVKVR